MTIHIINGPNLNMLGSREPSIYGSRTFESYLEELRQQFTSVRINYYQSNHEGALIDKLQSCTNKSDALIINAGAYSHTSLALADALTAVNLPVVEVHISNVFRRESYRHHSYLSAVCEAVISGLGLHGYQAAAEYLIKKYQSNNAKPEH